MSWRVKFTPEAVAHLAAIEEYIINAGAPVSATRYVDAIVDYCERLQTFPERGQNETICFRAFGSATIAVPP